MMELDSIRTRPWTPETRGARVACVDGTRVLCAGVTPLRADRGVVVSTLPPAKE